MSIIYKKTVLPESNLNKNIAFGGGGGGGNSTRGINGSPNAYSSNHSNMTRSYGWRSDRTRLDNISSDECLDDAVKAGITAGVMSKKPDVGLATGAVDYVVCKIMD